MPTNRYFASCNLLPNLEEAGNPHAMKAIAFLSTTMLTVSTVFADEDSKLYFKTEAGAAFQQNVHVKNRKFFEGDLRTETGPRVDLSAGYQFKESLSVELNTGFEKTKLQNVAQHDLYQVPMMANLVWKYPKGKFNPVLGAGFGGVQMIMDPNVRPYSTGSDLVLGCQAMSGLGYRCRKNFEIGLTYKFLYATTATPDNGGGARVGPILTHSVLAAFVCNF